MIKLSDVKVRPKDRTRVRYRLVEYARAHGPEVLLYLGEQRPHVRRIGVRPPFLQRAALGQ